MPRLTKAQQLQEDKDLEWESQRLNSDERRQVKNVLQEMESPPEPQDLDLTALRQLTLTVCLHLKSKNPRWERFITKKSSIKAKKFHTLEALVQETFK